MHLSLPAGLDCKQRLIYTTKPFVLHWYLYSVDQIGATKEWNYPKQETWQRPSVSFDLLWWTFIYTVTGLAFYLRDLQVCSSLVYNFIIHIYIYIYMPTDIWCTGDRNVRFFNCKTPLTNHASQTNKSSTRKPKFYLD